MMREEYDLVRNDVCKYKLKVECQIKTQEEKKREQERKEKKKQKWPCDGPRVV